MSISIYTSCALNYLPKARALAESLRRHQPDATLTLCLNDVVPAWLDLQAEPFDRVWLPQELGYDESWIFQHNVMELCTAVKGRALKRLMEEDPADLHIYLDPDVYLFHSLEPVFGMMEGASIGLIPHINCPEETDIGVQLTEMSVTEHGIYNLGHLILRPDQNGKAFADWWAARLDRYCFDDREHGLFTDQRWVDLVPAIFQGVRILRTASLDVASWNLSGRTLTQNPPSNRPTFEVDEEPLITYHFSGTGANGTHRRVRETFDPGNCATAEIERIYEAAIERHGQQRLGSYPHGFGEFDDGTEITAAARKLYRRHGDLRRAFPQPFRSKPGAISYLSWLREHRPGVVDGFVIPPARRTQAFIDLFDSNFYLATYPDVREAVGKGDYRSAIDHYCQIGSRLFYDPNEFFVSSFYFEKAYDYDAHLLADGRGTREGTLLWHYIVCGLPNALEPIEYFDSRWYLASNPDLCEALRAARITTPLAHFLQYGAKEGRDPGPSFNGATYLQATPRAAALSGEATSDVRGAFGAFVRLGGVDGRVGELGNDDTSENAALACV